MMKICFWKFILVLLELRKFPLDPPPISNSFFIIPISLQHLRLILNYPRSTTLGWKNKGIKENGVCEKNSIPFEICDKFYI